MSNENTTVVNKTPGGCTGKGFDVHPENINRRGRDLMPDELKKKTMENKEKLLSTYQYWTFIDNEEFMEVLRLISTKPADMDEEKKAKLKKLNLSTLDVYVIRLLSKGMAQGDGRIDVLLNRVYGKSEETHTVKGSLGIGERLTADEREAKIKELERLRNADADDHK